MKWLPAARRIAIGSGMAAFLALQSWRGAEAANLVQRANLASARQGRGEIGDVRLDDRGALHGQLVSRAGEPLAAVQIVLRRQDDSAVAVQSGARGHFQVGALSPGLYEIETPLGGGVVRIWSANAAPPIARAGILVVAETGDVVRGQFGATSATMNTLANPWTLGLVTAAAIGLPIALEKAPASN